MSMYVCNATPRQHHLNYRIPGDERVYERIISPGTQYKVPHEEPQQESAIIKQLESYGAVKPSKVNGDRHFSGLIFSEKVIPLDAIRAGLSEIDSNAIARALEHRTAAALGGDAVAAKEAQAAGATASNFEVAVVEQPRPGVDTQDLQKSTIQVNREGMKPRKNSRRN